MTNRAATITDEAINWLIQQRDPAFADWAAFTAWLEADPKHADIYHEVVAADMEAASILIAPLPMRSAETKKSRRPRAMWLAGALAASIAAIVGYRTMPAAAEHYIVETVPGQVRTVMLEAGTTAALNGDSKLVLDRDDPRYAKVERGQVLFNIRHDTERPFRVEAAGLTLLDAGTRFEVTRSEGELAVAVAEGLVIVDPARSAIRVPAGRAFSFNDGRPARLSRVATNQVGAWRDGRLFFDGEPLAKVAADLSRSLGAKITAEPSVALRPFHGVISLDRAMRRNPRALEVILGVDVRRSADEWVLSEPQ
jgi:transmembrane sensor